MVKCYAKAHELSVFACQNGYVKFPGIEFPWARLELLSHLEHLADNDYQWRVWVRHVFPTETYFDNFDEPVHFLFDDFGFADGAMVEIGWTLYDEHEAELVTAVVNAIDALLERHGTELTDEQYLMKPEWQAVLAAAKTAYPVLRDNTPADMTWDSV